MKGHFLSEKSLALLAFEEPATESRRLNKHEKQRYKPRRNIMERYKSMASLLSPVKRKITKQPMMGIQRSSMIEPCVAIMKIQPQVPPPCTVSHENA